MADELFDGNGHEQDVAGKIGEKIAEKAIETRAGAKFTLDGHEEGGASVTTSITQQLSAIQTLLTAPTDEQYRMALLLCDGLTPDRRKKGVNALSWCRHYHGDITPIVDMLVAEAGANRLQAIVDIFTHMRITNTSSSNKDRSRSGSPIK